jgi:subtilase family serine protease
MIHLPQGPRSLLARLAYKPLAACAAVVLPLALAGGALAAQTALASGGAPGPAVSVSSPRPAVAAHPRLTTNTPVCLTSAPRGHLHCFAVARTPADHVITADSSGPPSTALTPADIQSAYNLPSATAGGGQTVYIVDAGDDPTAEQDLAVFRSQYGLPPCTTANGCFTKVNQEGQTSPLPPEQCGSSSGGCWPVEESLDLDAVSSACPNCNMVLVEANDASSNLFLAENEAVALGAKFISNSWGESEYPGETQDEQTYFDHPGVAITASAGDGGYGVNFPSASQYVTAVGGTTLTKDSSVPRGWDESVWDTSPTEGTGSGCSAYEPQPSTQQGIPALDAVCQDRATADVSADADPASGLAVYDTTGESGWLQVGGTSLASPLIAATYALAGQPAAGTDPSSYPTTTPASPLTCSTSPRARTAAAGTCCAPRDPGGTAPRAWAPRME